MKKILEVLSIKQNNYLASKANLEDCCSSIKGICELSSNKLVGDHGLRDVVSSDDVKCISDNEVDVGSLVGTCFTDFNCDRSIIVLKRGETDCCNPLQIFKSSVGISFEFHFEK